MAGGVMQESQWSVLSELFSQLMAALFGVTSEPPPISFAVSAVEQFEGRTATCAEGAFGLGRGGAHDVVCLATGGFVAVKATDGSGAERSSYTGLLDDRGDRTPVASDMNGDGRLDLVVLADTAGGIVDGTQVPCELAVLLGDGAGGFAPGPSQTLQHVGDGLGAGDFDEDGEPDIVVPYGQISSTPALAATVLLNRPGGQFELRPYRDEAASPFEQGVDEQLRIVSDVLVFDANGDEHADVVFVAAAAEGPHDQDSGTLHTLLGDGQGGLRAGPSIHLGMWGWRFPVAAADYDEDGSTDVVVALVRSYGSGAIELPKILFGSRDGGFSVPVGVPPTEASAEVHSADYDGDGHVDLMTSGVAGPIHVYTGRGDGTFAPPIGFSVGRGPYWLTALDFALDGSLDALAVTVNGLEHVVLPLQAGTLEAPRVHSFIVPDHVRYAAHAPVIVDFDGDSDHDVVHSHTFGVLALLNDGAGGFRALDVALFSRDEGSWPRPYTVGDVNGDGLVDALHVLAPELRVHLQQSDGTWKPLPPIRIASEPRGLQVTLADANGDGRSDIFEDSIASQIGSLAVHVQDANGQFLLWPMTSFEGRVTRIEDVDGDGCSDVWLSVVEYVGIMTADCSGGFTLEHFVAGSSDVGELDYVDMNLDGRKDFVTRQGIALASPSGGYEQPRAFPDGSWAARWITDLNADGLLDVALSGAELVALAGDGHGHLGPPHVVWAHSTDASAMSLGDLAGDALPDAIRVNVFAASTYDRPESYGGLPGALVELTVIENISAR